MPKGRSEVQTKYINASMKPSIQLLIQKAAILGIVVSATLYFLLWLLRAVLGEASSESVPFPPKDLEEVRMIFAILENHSNERWAAVLLLYSTAFLVKQTFAIPGSALLNILGGALYGQFWATLLVTFLTATGSTLCYLLSWSVNTDPY